MLEQRGELVVAPEFAFPACERIDGDQRSRRSATLQTERELDRAGRTAEVLGGKPVAVDGVDAGNFHDLVVEQPGALASVAQSEAARGERGTGHDAAAQEALQVDDDVE